MEQIRIDIHPVPASRPRVTKNGTYNAPKYSTYKNALTWLIKEKRIPKGDYMELHAVFVFPYPKNTPKKDFKLSSRHRKRPDIDNLTKGLMDALEQANVIKDDSQIWRLRAQKIYENHPTGYIAFDLT